MRNTAIAAIPLAIALAGGGLLPGPDLDHSTRYRIAETFTPPQPGPSAREQDWLERHNRFGAPVHLHPDRVHNTLIVRQGYSLSHDDLDLIADWVAFKLTKDFVEGDEKRPGTSAFKPDPKLPRGRRAELGDYKGWNNIFDRGHQVASGDSKGRGKTVIRESFFLSNMTPQSSQLNRVRWRLLEQNVQELAESRGEIWVVTGPVFEDDDSDGLVEYTVIGSNQVAVPTGYYKIVLAERENPQPDEAAWEAMAFLVPNRPISDPFEEYLVSIDEVERLTGLDFFSQMPDPEEDALEANAASELLE